MDFEAVRKGDPSAIAKLADIDPEFQEALTAAGPLPTPDYTNVAAFRDGAASNESAALETVPNNPRISESELRIPMRDRFEARAILVKPKVHPDGGSPLVVLFFGGGFFTGSPKQQVPFARSLAEKHGATILLPEYRLAPEHRFPISSMDGFDAVKFAAANAATLSANTDRGFIVGGVSSGAQVANIAVHAAKDEGLAPRITGMWLSITRGAEEVSIPDRYSDQFLSMKQCANAPTFDSRSVEAIDVFSQSDHKSPWFSSFNRSSSMAGLPRSFLLVCGLDPYRDGALILERELRTQGVETKLVVLPGLPHGFWAAFPKLEASKKATEASAQGMEWLLSF